MKARGLIFALLASAAVPKFAAASTESMMRADMLARLEGAEHKADSPSLASPIGQTRFTGLPFQEAIDFFRAKVPMPAAEFRAIEDRYKTKGFTIAKIEDLNTLRAAHAALGDAIEQGLSGKDTTARLRQVLGEEGRLKVGDFHLQTVINQAQLGAYAAGRYAQLTHPDVLKARPFWQYWTAGDGRVRPAHRAMHGKIFPADSAVWRRWYPPNGFRCRCAVNSLSAAEVHARGLTVEEGVPDRAELPDGTFTWMRPDPGFEGSPATARTADAVCEKIDKTAAETGALQATPEDLNRAADAERNAKVDRSAGLDEKRVEEILTEQPVVNVYPTNFTEEAPREGQALVDWHMYSPDIASADQLVTRLVQHSDELYGLKDKISVGARATYFKDWPTKWQNVEVAFDDALQARLPNPAPGGTVARSTEYILRLRASPAELPTLLAFLEDNAEDPLDEEGRKIFPLRRTVMGAWDVQDVRVSSAGAPPPEREGWKHAWRNTRRLNGQHDEVVLSKGDEPLPGFDRAERILINARLWGVL